MKLAKSDPTDRFGRLLVIVIITFMASGIAQAWATTLTAALNFLLVVVAFRTTGARTSMPRVAAVGLVAFVALLIAAFADNGSNAQVISSFAQFLLLTVLIVALLRAVLSHEVISVQTILGAVAAYVLIGMALSYLYLGMDIIDNQQFSLDPSTPSAYPEFSFVVLTTLGFGNQLPTASFSSRMVVMEAVIGQIFLATFVARLVTLYPRRDATGPPPDAS